MLLQINMKPVTFIVSALIVFSIMYYCNYFYWYCYVPSCSVYDCCPTDDSYSNYNYSDIQLQDMGIYIINLERSPERREYMSTILDEQGLSYEFVNAVDGRELDDSYVDSLTQNAIRTYGKGEIGCFLSHLKTYQTFLKSDKDYCLILEDDVTFADDFVHKLNVCLSEVPDFDIFYCFDRGLRHFYTVTYGNVLNKYFPESWNNNLPLKIQEPYSEHCMKTGHLLDMRGVILSRKAAQQLLSNIDEMLAPIDVQIHFNNVKDGLNIYNSKECLIEQDKSMGSVLRNT